MGAYKEAHGGSLVDLYFTEGEAEAEQLRAGDFPTWDLSARQLCDLDLLTNGAYSPLTGFHTENEYQSVCNDMRLPDGTLWPIPIVLDVSEAFAEQVALSQRIALRDPEGVLLATMDVSSIYRPDKTLESQCVYGTTDDTHSGVHHVLHATGPVYLGGRVYGVEPQTHYDFKVLRDTPSELRGRFRKLGWRNVVAFQTRNPLHRAHQELTFRAAKEVQANLLIQPVVGMTKPGDINHLPACVVMSMCWMNTRNKQLH